MKKFLSLVLVCVMIIGVLSILSGCGSGEKDSESVTINWYMKKPVSDMSRQKEVEDVANKIIFEKLGIRLSFHFIESAAWKDRLNILLSTGTNYDIVSLTGTEFITNAQKDCFLDIGDLVNKSGKSILEKSNDFVWDAAKINGKLYGVPGQNFYVPYSAFAYRKDVVEKYNFDYTNANTYSAAEPFLKQIKEKESGIVGFAATANGAVSIPKSTDYSVTNLNFLCYDNKEQDFKEKHFIKSFEDNYRGIYQMAKNGYISPDAVSKNESLSEMKTGKYAIVNGRRDAEKSTNLYGFDCVESNPTYGVISTTDAILTVNSISAKSKHAKESIELLNLIWEDTYLSNTLAYGIEGKDFIVDKGDIHNYKDINEIHITTNSGTDVKWSIWHNWLGPLWDQWGSTWNSRENLEAMKEINASAEVSPIIGFVVDPTPIKTEVAQITSIYTNAEQVFVTGSMNDFDKYMDEYKQKLKGAGIDAVIAEVNKQFEVWKSSK